VSSTRSGTPTSSTSLGSSGVGPRCDRKVIGSGYLWRANEQPQPPLLDLWRHSLRPLLSEYLAGIDPEARREELERLTNVFLRGEN
jgi:hypothetical protein